MDDHLPAEPEPGGTDPGSVDPVPEEPPVSAFGGTDPGALGGGAPAMTEQDAIKHTRTLMDMRETAQALIIAQIADGKMDEYKKYLYSPWQKELLIDAWAPLIQSAGLTVNPWVKVLYAEGVSTGPLVILTAKNRNLRLENEQLKARIRQMKAQESGEVKITATPAANTNIPAPSNLQTRYDIKTYWKVDDNGFFEFNIDKVRIPIPHRKVRPQLTPENYRLLCKHNTKERIDRIFKINE